MKPRRSALRLPRYVQRKPLKNDWGYFFNVPTWARRAGCLVKNEALGSDYDAAVQRAESVLLPALDSWRTSGASDAIPAVAGSGTRSIGYLLNTVVSSPAPANHNQLYSRAEGGWRWSLNSRRQLAQINITRGTGKVPCTVTVSSAVIALQRTTRLRSYDGKSELLAMRELVWSLA
jgi:hypothetical protein